MQFAITNATRILYLSLHNLDIFTKPGQFHLALISAIEHHLAWKITILQFSFDNERVTSARLLFWQPNHNYHQRLSTHKTHKIPKYGTSCQRRPRPNKLFYLLRIIYAQWFNYCYSSFSLSLPHSHCNFSQLAIVTCGEWLRFMATYTFVSSSFAPLTRCWACVIRPTCTSFWWRLGFFFANPFLFATKTCSARKECFTVGVLTFLIDYS